MRLLISQKFVLSLVAVFALGAQSVLAKAESNGSARPPLPQKEYEALFTSSLRVAERLFYEGQLEDALHLLDADIRIIKHSNWNMDEELGRLLITYGKYSAFQSFTTNSGYEDARAALRAARKIAGSVNNEYLLSDGLLFTGFVLYSKAYNTGEGDYGTALGYLQSSLQLKRELGDSRGISEALIYLGIVHERQGDETTALAHYQEALALSDRNDYKLEKSYATRHIAFVKAAHGDLDGALSNFLMSLALREEIGFKIYLPFSYLSVGQIYSEMGNLSEAQVYYDKAYAMAQRLDFERVQVLCLLALGENGLRGNDKHTAARYFQKAGALSESIQYAKGVERANEGVARTR